MSKHTPEQCRLAIKQRDRLLARLQNLVSAGRLGHHDIGDAYSEVSFRDILAAERVCQAARAAIAKATGEGA